MNWEEALHMRWRCWRYRFKSETPSIRFVRNSKFLRGATLIDVGANKGIYSIYMSRAAGSNGKVIAFEAQPELGSHLQSVKEYFHLSNLQIENTALSSSAGKLTLHRNKVGHGGASFDVKRDSSSEQAVNVPVTTLDEYIGEGSGQKVAFIKCDVEGHELRVFKGGEQLLKRDMPVLLFECDHEIAEEGELFRYLVDLGYDGFFFYVAPEDHVSFYRRGRGAYIHYSKFSEYSYCRPTVDMRNYIFMRKGLEPDV